MDTVMSASRNNTFTVSSVTANSTLISGWALLKSAKVSGIKKLAIVLLAVTRIVPATAMF